MKEENRKNISSNYLDQATNAFWREDDVTEVPTQLALITIAAALVEIRDELRIMNERSNDNGKT